MTDMPDGDSPAGSGKRHPSDSLATRLNRASRRCRYRPGAVALLVLAAAAVLCLSVAALALSYEVLHSFTGGSDGGAPLAGLVRATDSNSSSKPGVLRLARQTGTATQSVTSSEGLYDGNWSGTTDQGKTISFTIINNAVSSFSIGYLTDVGPCQQNSSVTFTYSPPQPFVGSTFSINEIQTFGLSVGAFGTFDSSTYAWGAASFVFSQASPTCISSGSTAWTATNQAPSPTPTLTRTSPPATATPTPTPTPSGPTPTPGSTSTLYGALVPCCQAPFPTSFEVGAQFTSSQNGNIVALRFWKSSLESTGHTVHLWSASGTQLASIVFTTDESPSGWQEKALANPVAISAGVNYFVSYNVNVEAAGTGGGLSSPILNPPLTALSSWYNYPGQFPLYSDSNHSNYFADIRFQPAATFTPTQTPTSTPSPTPTRTSTSGTATPTPTRTPPQCTFTFNSYNFTLPGAGGSGSIQVTASDQSCTWTPSKPGDGNWLTMSPTTQQTGSGTISFGAPANPSSVNSRSTAITVGNAIASITQAASTPTPILAVTPPSRSVGSAAGTSTFSVVNTGGGTLSYSASVTSGSSWLSITSGASGGNGGTITASYSANTDGQRSGTIRVTATGATGSPATLTVTQAAAIPSGRALGIDVNRRGNINWSQVYSAGTSFAIIKATDGYRASLADLMYTNPDFVTYSTGAAQAGVLTGAYHFARPYINSAKDEADFFLSVASSHIGAGHLPPALDIEDPYDDPPYTQVSSMGAAALSKWIREWCAEVESVTGKKPMLYMTPSFTRTFMEPDLAQYPLWIAFYETLPDVNPMNPFGPWNNSWTFLQYSVAGHSVNGVELSPVALDVFNGDVTVLNDYVGGRFVMPPPTRSRQPITIKPRS